MKPPRSTVTPNRRPKRQSKTRSQRHVRRHPTTPKESPTRKKRTSAWVTTVTRPSLVTHHPLYAFRVASPPLGQDSKEHASTEQDSDTHPNTVNRLTKVIDRPPPGKPTLSTIVTPSKSLSPTTHPSSLALHPSPPSTKSQTALSSRVDRYTLNST